MAEATIPLTLPVEQFTQTRYRCPYCRRSWTSLKRANEHRDKCWHRPGGCKTCRHADMENGWVVDCGIGEDLREPLGENLDGVAEFGARILPRGLCPLWAELTGKDGTDGN